MSSPRPTDRQIEEWFESLTTEYFFGLIKGLEQSADYDLMTQGFDTQSAEQLQAERGNLWGFKTAFEDMYRVFEDRSFEQLEEPKDERVGDLPSGEQGSY